MIQDKIKAFDIVVSRDMICGCLIETVAHNMKEERKERM